MAAAAVLGCAGPSALLDMPPAMCKGDHAVFGRRVWGVTLSGPPAIHAALLAHWAASRRASWAQQQVERSRWQSVHVLRTVCLLQATQRAPSNLLAGEGRRSAALLARFQMGVRRCALSPACLVQAPRPPPGKLLARAGTARPPRMRPGRCGQAQPALSQGLSRPVRPLSCTYPCTPSHPPGEQGF